MSNRLSFAQITPRREPAEWLPAQSRTSGLGAALRRLADFSANDAMPAAMARDLGLPAAPLPELAFAAEIERSRVRV